MSRPTVIEITPAPEPLDRDTFGGLVAIVPQAPAGGPRVEAQGLTKRIVSG